ncbi:FmdB family transcriptional regulator [Streptomyces sp. RKND-216]|uniref:FmdB family zinc ribbon protein n=1 Tax=Streptomyces sp. RKND-216 TaxID=2562581 RepID=UPI00109E1D9D|nr:FmdB family zinc ribbon protein [Streptomyces sp. RKND-216]THA25951.1 FmdB family transcriptional regulator [Streptomyces sp. RKND-216]
MPTYQYQCTECGDGLEVVQKFTDDSLTECPGCKGRLKKVFSAVGIVFKGSGFYRNDSRGSSSGSTASSSSASSSSSNGSSDTSSGSADSSAKNGSKDKGSGKSTAKSPAPSSAA